MYANKLVQRITILIAYYETNIQKATNRPDSNDLATCIDTWMGINCNTINTMKPTSKMNYTKEQLLSGDYVVYCDNEQEWKKLCEIVGFEVTTRYHGKYLYSPYGKTYSRASSRTDLGGYSDSKKIITLQDILGESASTVRTLSPENAKRIIDMACATWKRRLADKWAKSIVLGEAMTIDDEFYNEMRKACTASQLEVFNEIFPLPFKVGDWVVMTQHVPYYCEMNKKGDIFKITEIKDGDAYFKPGYCVDIDFIRHATPEEIKRATLHKDGDPCWVRDSDSSPWYLRYADGKGEFYDDQRKSGSTCGWNYSMPFDPNNLPVLD